MDQEQTQEFDISFRIHQASERTIFNNSNGDITSSSQGRGGFNERIRRRLTSSPLSHVALRLLSSVESIFISIFFVQHPTSHDITIKRQCRLLLTAALLLSIITISNVLYQTGSYGAYGARMVHPQTDTNDNDKEAANDRNYYAENTNSELFHHGQQDSTKHATRRFGTISYLEQNRHKAANIPKVLQNLVDISISNVELKENSNSIPFFFHIPRSGGSSMKDIMGSCLGLVGSTDVGARYGHEMDNELKIVFEKESSLSLSSAGEKIRSSTGQRSSRFVNVDMSTVEGIQHAKKLGLMNHGHLSDYVVTQHLYAAADLFTPTQKGRMFTLIRHPIERAVSLFHYLSIAKWEPTYDPNLANMSIEMWARRGDKITKNTNNNVKNQNKDDNVKSSSYNDHRIEHNWMTRFLSNELEGELTLQHLEVAKEVLRSKCLIGLFEAKVESFERFQTYFGWGSERKDDESTSVAETTSTPSNAFSSTPDHSSMNECVERCLHWGWPNKNSHPLLEEGSKTYKLLLAQNEFDMELYHFAKELFDAQAVLFENP